MSALIKSILIAGLIYAVSLMVLKAQEKVLSPEEFFGFKPGTNRELINYEKLIEYLDTLDVKSERVKMIEIGKSPFDKPMYICFISSPENIASLDELKSLNKRLALDPEIPDDQRTELFGKGRVFVMAALSMHSREVGPSQSAPLIAYDLAVTTDENKLNWLENVVYMMVPCHNPDGMDMIVENYYKYKGTKYEGSDMPGVYHKYIGHDNNRDFVTLSQTDTRAIAAIYNKDWFPQVAVQKHQMGSSGVRYVVPPSHDPIAENVDASLWNWIGIFGTNMIKDMTSDSLAGIAQRYVFDDFWPGSTGTCVWTNVIGMLTEAANAQTATPVFIEPNEMSVVGKGLSEHKKSVNMPLPWEGGWWGLEDIVKYEISSTLSMLKTASSHREEILKFRNDLCRSEVNKGKSEAPFYFIMPLNQSDQSELAGTVNLLREHGISVFELKNELVLENVNYHKGDIVVPLAQPFRPLIKEIFEPQEYPLRHYTPGGEAIKPYGNTSWSLPLHRGVKSFEISVRSKELENSLNPIESDYQLKSEFEANQTIFLFTSRNNESYKAAFVAMSLGMQVKRLIRDVTFENELFPAGSFIIATNSYKDSLFNQLNISPVPLKQNLATDLEEIKMPRIALVESWFQDLDAGWTRFLFDDYGIPYSVLRPQDFEKANLKDKFDMVVFPSEGADIIKDGKFKRGENFYLSNYPPEYTKGLGIKGMDNLMNFLDNGGIIISWGESVPIFDNVLQIKVGNSDEVKEEFRLPFRNVADELTKQGLYCPGSLVKVELAGDNPLTWGMPEEAGILFQGSPVFTTSVPVFDMDRRVIAHFPEKDLLISGYIEKEETLANKSAMIWLKKGRGQLVLMSFSPQFRASTQGTFKLLFNSLLLKKLQ
jgi:hypothetical protein